MGRRSATDTVARVFVKLLTRSRWTQAELAREIDVDSRVLGRILREIQQEDPRLERTNDPPNVVWRAPRGWVPTGVVIETALVTRIERLLGRLPVTAARESALLSLKKLRATARPLPQEPRDVREDILTTYEDGLARRVAVLIQYHSSHSGDVADRHVSVQSIAYDKDPRLVAVCHRDDTLKWFRVDATLRATLDAAEPYRRADEALVGAFLAESFQRFHGTSSVETYTCFLRDPSARWVLKNLPEGLTVSRTREGTRITARTTALDVLARFVVSHGGLVEAESPALRARVRDLAARALHIHSGEKPSGSTGSFGLDPALIIPQG